jgi:hypothetical protein
MGACWGEGNAPATDVLTPVYWKETEVRTRRSLTRVRLAACAAAGALALALMAATPAAAHTNSSQHAAASGPMANQQTVNAVAATVNQSAPGFAGIEVNPSKLGVTVYWHGRPPASVTATAMASASDNRVKLQFLSAPYSLAQLLALRNAIISSPGYLSSGISITSIYPQATGLFIGVTNGDSSRARSLSPIATTTIPITYFAASAVPLSVPGRYNDQPPFKGGAIIWAYTPLPPPDDVAACTSGFGMHFASKPSEYFILTAAHCMREDQLGTQPFWTWEDALKVGQTFSWSPGNDAVDIATSVGVKGAGGSHQIYLGPASLTSASGQSLTNVVGASSVTVGDSIYQSGAFSGTRGPAKVDSVTESWIAKTTDGISYTVFGAYAATSNKSEFAGEGDSGGPVYVPAKGGVSAIGIVSAAPDTDTAPCVGIMLSGRKCFYSLYFPLMTGTSTSIESDLNVRVNTP